MNIDCAKQIILAHVEVALMPSDFVVGPTHRAGLMIMRHYCYYVWPGFNPGSHFEREMELSHIPSSCRSLNKVLQKRHHKVYHISQ